MSMTIVYAVYAIVFGLALIVSIVHGIWRYRHTPALRESRLENKGEPIKAGISFLKIVCR